MEAMLILTVIPSRAQAIALDDRFPECSSDVQNEATQLAIFNKFDQILHACLREVPSIHECDAPSVSEAAYVLGRTTILVKCKRKARRFCFKEAVSAQQHHAGHLAQAVHLAGWTLSGRLTYLRQRRNGCMALLVPAMLLAACVGGKCNWRGFSTRRLGFRQRSAERKHH